jgi:hypothetical protein
MEFPYRKPKELDCLEKLFATKNDMPQRIVNLGSAQSVYLT